MLIQRAHIVAFLLTTPLNLFLFNAGGGGRNVPLATAGDFVDALGGAIGGSFICQFVYVMCLIVDLIRRKHRTRGWLICSVASVATFFLYKVVMHFVGSV